MPRSASAASAALSLLAVSSLFAPTPSHASVLRFAGSARIQLFEFLDHEDRYDVARIPAAVTIELTGPRAPLGASSAAGTATITLDDGTLTTVRLTGTLQPPEGSGGLMYADGAGDDGGLYCFRIRDHVDAPTPRSDYALIAFEPGDRFAEGHLADNLDAVQEPTNGFPLIPTDPCGALTFFYDSMISGDFSFTTVL
jgi:hypothetical protein